MDCTPDQLESLARKFRNFPRTKITQTQLYLLCGAAAAADTIRNDQSPITPGIGGNCEVDCGRLILNAGGVDTCQILTANCTSSYGIQVLLTAALEQLLFPDLTIIEGWPPLSYGRYLNILNNSALQSIDLGELELLVGDGMIADNPNLTAIDLSSFQGNTDGRFTIQNNGLTSLSLPNMVSTSGFVVWSNPNLTSVSFASWDKMDGGDFGIWENNSLTTVSMPVVTNVGGSGQISFISNPQLTVIDLNTLKELGGSLVDFDNSDAPRNGLYIYNCPSCNVIAANTLTRANFIAIQSCDAEFIRFFDLKSVYFFSVAYTNVERLLFGTNLHSVVEAFWVIANNSLTRIDINSLTNLYSVKTTILITRNPLLTTINVPDTLDASYQGGSYSTLNFSNNALSQTTVDNILKMISQSWEGYLFLDGGTNAAPSAQGEAYANMARARGALIYTN